VDFEGAYQSGYSGTKDIDAYALASYVQKEFNGRFSPKLKLELNLASGDSNPSDEKSETFVPLYQTTHDPYGIIDLLRWQNMREMALVGNLKITEKLSIQPELHQYWLDRDTDSWYSASGSVLFSNTTGNTENEIGSEASIAARYKMNKNLETEFGYSHFFSGRVSELAGEGDYISFVYFQTIVNF
jgi:hypothetical protein